jgi:hypothetical protein
MMKAKFPGTPSEHTLALLVTAMALCAASSVLAVVAVSNARLVVFDTPAVTLVDTLGPQGNQTNVTTVLPEVTASVGLFDFCSGGICYQRQSRDFVPCISSFLGSWVPMGAPSTTTWESRMRHIAGTSLRLGFSQAESCGLTSTSYAVVSGVIVTGWAVTAVAGILASVSCAWLCVSLHQMLPGHSASAVRQQRAKELNLRYLAGIFSGLEAVAASIAFALTLWSLLRRWGCEETTYCSFVVDPINTLIAESGADVPRAASCEYGLSFFASCISFGLAVLAAVFLLVVTVPLLRSRATNSKRYMTHLLEQLWNLGQSRSQAQQSSATSPRAVALASQQSQLEVAVAPPQLDSSNTDSEYSERSPTPPEVHHDRVVVASSDERQVETDVSKSTSSLLGFTQRTVVTSTKIIVRESSSTSHIQQLEQETVSCLLASSREEALEKETNGRRAVERDERTDFSATLLLRQKVFRSDNLVVFHQCTLDWLFGPVLDVHLLETFQRQDLIRKWHGKLKKIATEQAPLPLPYFLGFASHYSGPSDNPSRTPTCVPTEQWLDAVDADFCHSFSTANDLSVSPVSPCNADDVEVSSASEDDNRQSPSRQDVDDWWSLQQRYAVLVQKAASRANSTAPKTTETPPRRVTAASETFDRRVAYELSLLKATAGRSVAADRVPWGYRTSEAAKASFAVDSSWGSASVDDRLTKLRQTRPPRGGGASSSNLSSVANQSADTTPGRAASEKE